MRLGEDRQRSAVARERFRKRLIWTYAVTLIGVLTLLAAATAPSLLSDLRHLGVALTLAGGILQIVATWDYARRL